MEQKDDDDRTYSNTTGEDALSIQSTGTIQGDDDDGNGGRDWGDWNWVGGEAAPRVAGAAAAVCAFFIFFSFFLLFIAWDYFFFLSIPEFGGGKKL